MSILVLSPHADDEVLGMGGSIARWVSEGKSVSLAVLTGHGVEAHPIWTRDRWDQVRSECLAAGEILGISKIVFRELPAACLDNVPAWQVNRVVADLVAEISPQELYIPFEFDLHKDHAAIAYAAYVAARPYLAGARSIRRLMAYETLSETHLWPAGFAPAFQPNVFVSIEKTLEKKLAAMSVYKSQLHGGCSPRSLTALTALARLRGAHVGSEAAEGFMLLGEYLR